jgi:uncharacterized membrane protein (UPF0127 family)
MPLRDRREVLRCSGSNPTLAGVQSYLRIIALSIGLAIALGLSLVAFSEGGARWQLVRIRERDFKLEVADTEVERLRGLRGRASLAVDAGMLIQLDDPAVLAYSTRYTPFPVDVLYLDEESQVVRIDRLAANDDRLTASSSITPVSGAILLRGGTVDQLHLAPGYRFDLVRRNPRRSSDAIQ